jgi:hypothetical protein
VQLKDRPRHRQNSEIVQPIGATVSDPQRGALLGAASNATFLMTIVVAKHFNFGDVADAANKVFWEYGNQSAVEWPPFLQQCNACALFSYVLSVILTKERSLQFQLRQDSMKAHQITGRRSRTTAVFVIGLTNRNTGVKNKSRPSQKIFTLALC